MYSATTTSTFSFAKAESQLKTLQLKFFLLYQDFAMEFTAHKVLGAKMKHHSVYFKKLKTNHHGNLHLPLEGRYQKFTLMVEEAPPHHAC